MKVSLLGIKGRWREIADSARTTIGLEPGEVEPSSNWRRRMLLAEHSPIRQLIIKWKWTDLLYWVHTHFARHKFGVEWWVRTSRTDRTGVDRANLSHASLINMEGEANAQAIISISRKRLCKQASKETMEAWRGFLSCLRESEPELYGVCVPDCIYRGYCYEFQSCGYHRTQAFRDRLEEYRRGINL